jgi:DNA processing protein
MNSIREIEFKDFPERLKEIPSPPRKIYVRGELPNESYKFLTVVGSRAYTPYGKSTCETLIRGLRGLPVVIVSGLAFGIDSIAHEEALNSGIKTIAVPGSGLDDSVLYPRNHRMLAKKIIESGGCLLSEFEPNFKATTWSFPQRNRIMAGMSHAVLVIEAELKSGTLITSKHATDYNRDVLAVPGSIFSTKSEGPHMLIRLGATPITSPKDLIEALGFEAGEKNQKLDLETFSPEERDVLEKLDSPKTRDELMNEIEIDSGELSATLSLLEIKGVIKEVAGKVQLG